jgi:hypothetical protein
MKLLGISSIILAGSAPLVQGFMTPPTTTVTATTTTLQVANVLEGTEIEKDFTPINNMLLVKKGEVIDQTEGGIFLTGKVCMYLLVYIYICMHACMFMLLLLHYLSNLFVHV